MSLELIRHNTPILRQAAEQFTVGDVAGGKSSFAMVHQDVKEGVYYTMWQRGGSPNIPKFGTNQFNDSNGLSSASIEKAVIIYRYFQSKGITTIPSDHRLLREQTNSNRHPVDVVDSFGRGVYGLKKTCDNCTPDERKTVLVVTGGAIIGAAALTGISIAIGEALNRIFR